MQQEGKRGSGVVSRACFWTNSALNDANTLISGDTFTRISRNPLTVVVLRHPDGAGGAEPGQHASTETHRMF